MKNLSVNSTERLAKIQTDQWTVWLIGATKSYFYSRCAEPGLWLFPSLKFNFFHHASYLSVDQMSIHPLSLLLILWGLQRGLVPIPADIGRDAVHAVDRSTHHFRVTSPQSPCFWTAGGSLTTQRQPTRTRGGPSWDCDLWPSGCEATVVCCKIWT